MVMITKKSITLGTGAAGSLLGLAYGLKNGKGFWKTWGFSLLGGMMGNMAGTATGYLTNAPGDPLFPIPGVTDTPPAAAQRQLSPSPTTARLAPNVPSTLAGWDGSGQPPGNW